MTFSSGCRPDENTTGGRYVSSCMCLVVDIELFQEIEATLHCVMSIQEAVPLEGNSHLKRLFSPDILGKLPTTGQNRVRRTVLGIIGKCLALSRSRYLATHSFG